MSDQPQKPLPEQWRPTPRQVVLAIVFVVLLVFALVNLDEIPVDFVVDTVRVPLIVVIVVVGVLGGLLGALVRWRHERDG